MAHLANLASTLIELGELDAAERAATEVATLARAYGRDELVIASVWATATVALLRGDFSRTVELLTEQLQLEQLAAFQDTWAVLDVAGTALVLRGNPREGTQLLALADALVSQQGGRRSAAIDRARAEALATARSELGGTAFDRAEARGRRLTPTAAYALLRATREPRVARRSSAPAASRSSSNRARRARR
jgi:hypothetical protein